MIDDTAPQDEWAAAMAAMDQAFDLLEQLAEALLEAGTHLSRVAQMLNAADDDQRGTLQ